MRTLATLLLASSLITTAASGCSEPRAPAERAGPEAVTIGYSALRISLPVFVAEERGLFERHGLDVTLRRYETAQPLVEEVLDGRIPAGGFAALPIVFNASARDGSRARIALAMMEDASHPVSYLLRRRGEAGIARVADLAGRRVGILPTIAYRRWLEAILRAASVDPATVQIVPIAPPQETAALQNGGVDALFTNDPVATATIASGVGDRLGAPAPVPAAIGAPLVFGSFLVQPRFARERPDVVRRILAALDEAVAAIDEDQDAARQAMTPYVRAPERPYVSRYPDALFRQSRTFGDPELAAAVRSMVDLGVLERPRDVSGWAIQGHGPR